MLRLAVIALVLVNLLLLVLEASKAPPAVEPAREPASLPADQEEPQLPVIQLLSELADLHEQGEFNTECFTVGPFETGEAWEQARTGLKDITVSVTFRMTEAQVERGLWVFLPPLGSFEEALAFARQMRQAGISDVNVISDGEWSNSISLGYFLNEANAMARRDNIRGLGFDATTRIQRDIQPRFWLDYAQATGSEYAAQILSASIPPGLHRPIPCAAVGVVDDVTTADDIDAD